MRVYSWDLSDYIYTACVHIWARAYLALCLSLDMLVAIPG